jgi:glycosyltransferase involved in cell wall biosynthesis
MATGTPVVLSQGCNLPEIDGVAGVVVPGQPDDTAEALSRLLADEPRRRELGEGARVFAHGFRRTVVMPEMLELLARMAGAAPPVAQRAA